MSPKKHDNLQAYAKYSALGLELAATVLVFVFGGVKLDEWANCRIPVFTLTLTALGLFASMYILIRKTKKQP